MSHFSVAVFSKNEHPDLYSILEPYDENLSVDPHIYRTKNQIVSKLRDDIFKLRENMAHHMENPEEFNNTYWLTSENINPIKMIPYYQDLLLHEKSSNEELYQFYRKENEDEMFDDEGNELSTYNPDSKWDWFVTGGRWSGMLHIKNENKEIKEVNEAFVKDLVDSPDVEEQRKHAKRFWEIIVLGNKLEEGEEMPFTWHDAQFYRDTYGTMNEFIKDYISPRTYAFIDANGTWIEPGQMGWFGNADTTPDSEIAYRKRFAEYMEHAKKENLYITIVDCHI